MTNWKTAKIEAMDYYKLQQIALGSYYPTQEEVKAIAQELLSIKFTPFVSQPSIGKTTLVYGKF